MSMNIEKLRQFSNRFSDKQKSSEVKYAAFVIPLRDGVIYLAERNTPPFKGLYSAIGGKMESGGTDDNDLDLTSSSFRLKKEGFERPTEAAIREFCEEMYYRTEFPKEFELDDFKIVKLFRIDDVVTGVSCYFRLVSVPSHLPFVPSPREIGKVNRLVDIDPTQINPLTKVALIEIRNDNTHTSYHDQLPSLDKLMVDYLGPVGGSYLLSY